MTHILDQRTDRVVTDKARQRATELRPARAISLDDH